MKKERQPPGRKINYAVCSKSRAARERGKRRQILYSLPKKEKSPPGSGRRNETILPGIYDEAAPTRSALPMQNNSGLTGRDYVAVHGVSRLEQRRRKQEAGRVRRTAP